MFKLCGRMKSSLIFASFALSWTEGSDKHFSLDDFGFLVFHSPYCKLVQKSLARLMLNDFLAHPSPNTETGPFTGLDAFRYVVKSRVIAQVHSSSNVM